MINWVGLLLRSLYYYSHLIGVRNFEFDWRTGRVFTTAWSNLYAVTINVFLVILFGFKLARTTTLTILFSKANTLFEYVIIIVTLLRIIAGLVTLLNRWRHKSQIMILTRDALRLILARPQVLRLSQFGILVKFFNGVMTNLFQLANAFETVRRAGTASFLEMGLQLWMSAILNLAIAQHFLMMLFVRAQYELLNTELRQVVEESRDLSYNPPRKGAFMTRCCSLADQLEDIARQQSQLQSMVTQLDEVIGVQVLMVYSGYYVFAVATAYLAYSMIKYDPMNLGIVLRNPILSLTWCFFYYMDAILNLFVTLHVQDDHKDMIRLLEQRTLFASGLDARLEEANSKPKTIDVYRNYIDRCLYRVSFYLFVIRLLRRFIYHSFESFQLQLLRNPFKLDVLKLFSVDRYSSMDMIASIILHSIFLIQYDMTYF